MIESKLHPLILGIHGKSSANGFLGYFPMSRHFVCLGAEQGASASQTWDVLLTTLRCTLGEMGDVCLKLTATQLPPVHGNTLTALRL